MTEKELIVGTSLESRSAAHFVQCASKFSSSITIKCDDKQVNAKSIMGIISLGILDGHNVTIAATGEDEESAVAALENFLK